MSDVKSKNLYELLGNTSDQDSDREPEPPTKAVDKPAARQGKRDAPKAAPVASAAPAGGREGATRRGGGFSGNEAAFRDRATGRNYNKDKPTDENETGVRTGRDSGPGVRRGGRGQRGPRRGGDRQNKTGQSEHQKQADHAWGGASGEGEWADEKAGEAIATQEVKEGGFDTTTDAPVDGEGNTYKEEDAEPEDTHKSYEEYMNELNAKRLEGLGLKEARQANEGAKADKKFDSAKAHTKETGEDYFAGQEKQRRERERASKKEFIDLDYSFKEQPRDSRGGRGGRGRGDSRGGRGDFEGRGRGRGRGDFEGRARAGRGRGGRGRGGAEGATASVAVNDESAFPSLGS